MKTKLNKAKHNKMISQNIKRAWGSLDSHLDYAYGKVYRKGETNAFHIRAINEYAEIILALSKSFRKR